MLHATSVSRHHGGQVVLDQVSLSVDRASRIGVVGPNGVGKSTLLRILAGSEDPDGGTVRRAPAETSVGFLPQEPDARPGETLRDYLARRTGVAAAEARMTAAAEALATIGPDEAADRTAADVESEYAAALEAYLAVGGADLDARIGAVCDDVGIPADRIDLEVQALSGGQAARAALAAILLSRFDVLLLDEPTNDLDFAGLDLLESFLARTESGLVVVSHDRAFLDAVVTQVVELHENTHRAAVFAGGWSDYIEARELARRQQYSAHQTYVAERDRLRERQRTQRSWADKGVRQSRTKATDGDKHIRHHRSQGSENQAAKVKATERALDRLDAVEKPWEGWQLQLTLDPAARSGDVVARLDAAVVRRGSFVLGPVDVELRRQDRLAVLGPNGCGKSTLLAAMLGTQALVDGERWLGPGVVVGELDQKRLATGSAGSAGSDAGTVLDGFLRRTGLLLSEGRSLLAKFGLGADHVDRRVDQLSPGERTRLVVAGLMSEGVNLLVLDEPTNHLDLEAIEQLESALEGYDGTLVLVTHDRRMLDAVRLTHTLDLGADGVVRER